MYAEYLPIFKSSLIVFSNVLFYFKRNLYMDLIQKNLSAVFSIKKKKKKNPFNKMIYKY